MVRDFMDENFLLYNEPAVKTFGAIKNAPIFDWHCHLSPREIYENRTPEDISELWFARDHYKWRAARSCGTPEKYITGDASGYEKFRAFARAAPRLIGNPVYHWCHLELRRYFGINDILNDENADAIWKKANAAIKNGGFEPRELIKKSGVAALFTTDDPADGLEYHRLIAEDKSFGVKVVPAFRTDKALSVDSPSWASWLADMEKAAGRKINGFGELCEALGERVEYFASAGCLASDCSFSYVPYSRADESELERIFTAAKNGDAASAPEADKFRTALMIFLSRKYAEKGWAQELHIGPMRNNNTLMFGKLGADAGYDSIDDQNIARNLSRFLDSLAVEEKLPKTILFALNPKDYYVLGSALGNFQNDEAESKIQLGSAWWFNDSVDGTRKQLGTLANLGALGAFIGMVTDSRSFLSYARHEYFRRILCGFIGELVENGLYPYDEKTLCSTARNIAYDNAVKYFGIKI